MRFYSFPAGSTGKSIALRIHDAATGRAKTDLVFNTANFAIGYYTANGALVPITLVTQTPTGAWASGGFVHRDGGDYRLDLPDAALASSTRLEVVAKTTNPVTLDIITQPVQIAVTAFDPLAAGPTEASINSAVEAGAVGTNVAAILAQVDTEIASILGDVAAILLDTSTNGVVLAPGALTIAAMSAEVAGLIKGGGTLKFAFNPGTGVLTIFEADGVTPLLTRTLTLEARDAVKAST